jgi:3-deoxy-7-phosphoheptulonate synthase
MIEVHNDPEHALSDGNQSQTPEQFDRTARKVKAMMQYMPEVLKAGLLGD